MILEILAFFGFVWFIYKNFFAKKPKISQKKHDYYNRGIEVHDLYTIPYSHYCDKIKWTLEYLRVPYREHKMLPLFHIPLTAYYTGLVLPDLNTIDPNKATGSPFSVPYLKCPNGTLLRQSSDIMMYLNTKFGKMYDSSNKEADGESIEGEIDLYPSRDVIDLERYAVECIGDKTRRIGYYEVLPNNESNIKLIKESMKLDYEGDTYVEGSSAPFYYSILLYIKALPLVNRILVKAMKIREDKVMSDIEYLKEQIQLLSDKYFSEECEDSNTKSGKYLFGDNITAADIALATLFAPILRVSKEEGYPADMIPMEKVKTKEVLDLIQHSRGSKIGKYLLSIYKERRNFG